jgi:hypothetical protein
LNQRLQEPGIEPPEVQVGEMDDSTHDNQPMGTNTVSARGMLR